MLNNILNIDGASTLSKNQQKMIMGGGDCQIFIRLNDGSHNYWTGSNYSVSEAQSLYNSGGNFTGATVTGYCCASCPPAIQ